MHPRHFFRGMLRKEEVASAFVATLFESRRELRDALLGVVLPAPEPGLVDEAWTVVVEADRVDVTLRSPTTTVLVENKIYRGAKQEQQLLRYYLGEIEARPERRVIAVFLAPRGLGQDEVDAVTAHPAFAKRGVDVAALVVWEDLAARMDLGASDPYRDFVRGGFDEILRCICEARQTKYPRVDARAVVFRIAKAAIEMLRDRAPDVRLSGFHGPDREEILTNGTPVTMWLHAVYELNEDKEPVGVVQDDGVHLILRTQIKLARKVRASSPLAVAWKAVLEAGGLEVPGRGWHQRERNDWLVLEGEASGREEELGEAMAAAGEAVLGAIRPYLGMDAG